MTMDIRTAQKYIEEKLDQRNVDFSSTWDEKNLELMSLMTTCGHKDSIQNLTFENLDNVVKSIMDDYYDWHVTHGYEPTLAPLIFTVNGWGSLAVSYCFNRYKDNLIPRWSTVRKRDIIDGIMAMAESDNDLESNFRQCHI